MTVFWQHNVSRRIRRDILKSPWTSLTSRTIYSVKKRSWILVLACLRDTDKYFLRYSNKTVTIKTLYSYAIIEWYGVKWHIRRIWIDSFLIYPHIDLVWFIECFSTTVLHITGQTRSMRMIVKVELKEKLSDTRYIKKDYIEMRHESPGVWAKDLIPNCAIIGICNGQWAREWEGRVVTPWRAMEEWNPYPVTPPITWLLVVSNPSTRTLTHFIPGRQRGVHYYPNQPRVPFYPH